MYMYLYMSYIIFTSFISVGLVGLAITSCIQITPVLGSLISCFTETEKRMVRVERVSQYIDETPKEKEGSTNVMDAYIDLHIHV